MSKRQVTTLWIIAIVLGLTVAIVKIAQNDSGQSATERKPGETLIADFPASEVAKITITGVTDTVELTKKDSQWVVANRDNYPAQSISVNEFIRMTANLEVTRCIEAGMTFAPRFGMDLNSNNSAERGITATFKDAANKEIATITLGKNIESERTPSPLGGGGTVGRYIRNHADESGFYATNQLFPSISYHPETWLADAFISPEKIESITLSKVDSDDPDWTITRESEEAEFKMTDTAPGEVLNTTTADPLKSLFSYARFDDLVPAAEIKNRSKPDGKRTAIIKTFEGFTYTIHITPEQGVDNKYLMTVAVDASLPEKRKTPEGETDEEAKAKDEAFDKRVKTLTQKLENAKMFEGRVFQVSQNTIDPLLKQRSELITKATPTTEAQATPATQP